MLARLSSASYPALSLLKTRDNGDFTIAFLDASAVMLDILSFYQERLANESYLRTAQQLQSLTELSRLIGYQPAPGVAASVYLAFTLTTAPNAPSDPTTPPITIPVGTQVQSVPAQGQTPQIFETSAAIPAKPDWNALPVLTALPWAASSATGMYLQGTATQLNPGDLILMLGAGRSASTPTSDWSVQFLTTVTVDTANKRTWIKWATPLQPANPLVTAAPQIFAFRQRAALFGYNAIEPWLISTKAGIAIPPGLLNSGSGDWAGLTPGATTPALTIDLDSSYAKVAAGSWLALMQQTVTASSPYTIVSFAGFTGLGGAANESAHFGPVTTVTSYLDLYQATDVTAVSRNDCGMSAKITRITPDATNDLSHYNARTTTVFAQTDRLTPAPQPLDYPLYGTLIDIQTLRPDLISATVIAISGTAQKITLNPGVSNLEFVPDQEGSASVPLNPGDTFTLIEPPALPFNSNGSIPSWSTSDAPLTLKVADASGRTGTLQGHTTLTPFGGGVEEFALSSGRIRGGHGPVILGETTALLYLSYFSLAAPSPTDPKISECALVTQTVGVMPPDTTAPNGSAPHTQFQLTYATRNCYCRATTTVNANVALATAGASVTEIVGNGAAATPNQSFKLRQPPLTYVQASTPNGRQSTLTLRANGVKWTEVPTLYGQAATAQVYAIENRVGRLQLRHLRRRRGRRNVAHRPEQHYRLLPSRLGLGWERPRRRNHHSHAASSRRQRGDQPGGRHGRRRPGFGGRRAHPRSPNRAHSGPSRFHRGLPELRRRLCRHCRGLRHLDSERNFAWRLPYSRRQWRGGSSPRQSHARQACRRAQELRQPAHPGHSGVVHGNAVRLLRGREIRPELRPADRAGRNMADADHGIQLCQSRLRPGRLRR